MKYKGKRRRKWLVLIVVCCLFDGSLQLRGAVEVLYTCATTVGQLRRAAATRTGPLEVSTSLKHMVDNVVIS